MATTLSDFCRLLSQAIGNDNYSAYFYKDIRNGFAVYGIDAAVASDNADDIIQNMLLKAAEKYDTSRDYKAASAFARRIVQQDAMNAARKMVRRATVSDSQQSDRDGSGSDQARSRLMADHGGAYHAPQSVDDANDPTANLSQEEYEIIRMRDSGMTYQQIGSVLGISLVTVRNRLIGLQ